MDATDTLFKLIPKNHVETNSIKMPLNIIFPSYDFILFPNYVPVLLSLPKGYAV